ncbi:MAG: hypothetical protein AAF846_29550 [Chloroflexota bacterium]
MLRKQKGRLLLSLLILMIYGFAMAMAGSISNYDGPAFLIFLFVFITPIVATVLGIVWNYSITLRTDRAEQLPAQVENTVEKAKKRKRRAIDDVLQELSDDDLIELRRRLQTGELDEVDLYDQWVGEDGELVRYNS